MKHRPTDQDDSSTKKRRPIVSDAYQPMIQHTKSVDQDAYQPIIPSKNLIGKTISPY